MSDSYFKLDAKRRAAIAASMPSEPLMEHTPTPWRVVENSSRYIGARVCAANKRVAETNSANAAFIVRACNAHDELVAALESIKGAISLEFVRKVAGAALAKVQPATVDTRQTQGWTSEL